MLRSALISIFSLSLALCLFHPVSGIETQDVRPTDDASTTNSSPDETIQRPALGEVVRPDLFIPSELEERLRHNRERQEALRRELERRLTTLDDPSPTEVERALADFRREHASEFASITAENALLRLHMAPYLTRPVSQERPHRTEIEVHRDAVEATRQALQQERETFRQTYAEAMSAEERERIRAQFLQAQAQMAQQLAELREQRRALRLEASSDLSGERRPED